MGDMNTIVRCENCNKEVGKDDKFCRRCGNKLKGVRMPVRSGAIVLSACLFIASIYLYFQGKNFDKFGANFYSNLCVSISIALMPTALISLINLLIIKEENRELTVRNNQALKESLSELVRDCLKSSFVSLQNNIEKLDENAKELMNLNDAGIQAAYTKRSDSLQEIRKMILLEEKEIYIVAMSLKGLLKCCKSKDEGLEILRLLQAKKENDHVDVHFILTHPLFAYFRENSDRTFRSKSIPDTILENVKLLSSCGFDAQDVKFIKTPPTIFGIMTSNSILLNPYPLQGKSYETLTIIINSKKINNYVYDYYSEWHFKGVWNNKSGITSLCDLKNETLKKLYDIKEVDEIINKFKNKDYEEILSQRDK